MARVHDQREIVPYAFWARGELFKLLYYKVPILRLSVLGNLRRCITQTYKRWIQIRIIPATIVQNESWVGSISSTLSSKYIVLVAATVSRRWQRGGIYHLPFPLFWVLSLELKMGDQLSNQNMISAVMVVVVVDYYDRYTKEAIRQFCSLLVEIKQYWGTWYSIGQPVGSSGTRI